ncbi:MAG TPA: glycosyltransferase [Nitrospirae bacterium]|nr:glycosyltransferase [Nitrospirota bacterium]
MTNNCLAVFFKVPQLGRVKTRLAQKIGEEMALEIYQEMLDETFRKVASLEAIEIIGFYDGEIDTTYCPFKKLYEQKGKELGERLIGAFEQLFKDGFEKVCIIGADSPTLPIQFIYDAFNLLERSRMVIGPTIDGGYYLIGLNSQTPEIFKNILWGSEKVFQQTMEIANNLKLAYQILPEWYDIDDISALEQMGQS